MPAKAQTFSVRLPDDMREQVDQLARITKRSRSFIVKEAVETYVRDRAAYIKELDEAVASIDTQPTYSAEEVFGWMSTWGTEDEKPLEKAKLRPSDPASEPGRR